MKLPFRSGNNKQGEVPGAPEPSAARHGQVSLRSQAIALLVAGMLLIAAPAAVVYLQTEQQLRVMQQQHAELVADLFASGVAQWLDNQVATAELVAKDPQLARTMMDGSEAERSAKAEELAYLFPASIRVRLLPPGVDEVNLEASPPIGYAAVDMLRHSETKDSPPPAEVHMSGTPQQHVNLVRRILDPAGRRIVGHLMVSFSVQQLEAALSGREVDGYLELQQVAAAPLVLASKGAAEFKTAQVDGDVAVHGSRWRVAYWAPVAGRAAEAALNTAALAAGIAALLFASIKVLREYERGVVFFLGRFQRVKGPGLVIVIPVIQQMVKVDLRTVTMDVPTQDVISRDNVSVQVNAVIYFRVLDAERAIIQVEDYHAATSQLAQTTLRSVLGQHDLDEMLSQRDKMNADIQNILDEQTASWGIKVTNVEIKHVDLNESMIRAIAKQAEAERERRAKIIHAEGELQASEKLLMAANVMSKNPQALQLRYLQTLNDISSENASTIIFPLPLEILEALGRGKTGQAE